MVSFKEWSRRYADLKSSRLLSLGWGTPPRHPASVTSFSICSSRRSLAPLRDPHDYGESG